MKMSEYDFSSIRAHASGVDEIKRNMRARGDQLYSAPCAFSRLTIVLVRTIRAALDPRGMVPHPSLLRTKKKKITRNPLISRNIFWESQSEAGPD